MKNPMKLKNPKAPKNTLESQKKFDRHAKRAYAVFACLMLSMAAMVVPAFAATKPVFRPVPAAVSVRAAGRPGSGGAVFRPAQCGGQWGDRLDLHRGGISLRSVRFFHLQRHDL